jgi:hypothetical protein
MFNEDRHSQRQLQIVAHFREHFWLAFYSAPSADEGKLFNRY